MNICLFTIHFIPFLPRINHNPKFHFISNQIPREYIIIIHSYPPKYTNTIPSSPIQKAKLTNSCTIFRPSIPHSSLTSHKEAGPQTPPQQTTLTIQPNDYGSSSCPARSFFSPPKPQHQPGWRSEGGRDLRSQRVTDRRF